MAVFGRLACPGGLDRPGILALSGSGGAAAVPVRVALCKAEACVQTARSAVVAANLQVGLARPEFPGCMQQAVHHAQPETLAAQRAINGDVKQSRPAAFHHRQPGGDAAVVLVQCQRAQWQRQDFKPPQMLRTFLRRRAAQVANGFDPFGQRQRSRVAAQ